MDGTILDGQNNGWDNLDPLEFDYSPLKDPSSNLSDQLNGRSSTLE